MSEYLKGPVPCSEDLWEKFHSKNKKTFKVPHFKTLILAALLSVTPDSSRADSNEIDIMTGCSFITHDEKLPVAICDEKQIVRYTQILEEAGYEVQDIDRYMKFMGVFQPILEYLNSFELTDSDIIAAMNLYDAWENKEKQPVDYILHRLFFLDRYPNPEIGLDLALNQIGMSI